LATTRTHPLARQLRRAFAQDHPGASDGQLLGRFVAARDEAAFEALVRRHGPMVLGVCRRLLRDHHDAHDAFQATFLVLLRKAGSVAPPEMLPNWLYGVARQTAVRARAQAAKRRGRERLVGELPEAEARQPELADDLRPVLDEELAGLPARYRVAVVLCDLEGRSHKEAAGCLGWPVGTLASRLSRGRRMLAKRLTRRGLAPPGGALTVIVSQEAAGRLPASLVSSTVRVGSLYGSGQAAVGALPPRVAALTEGVLRAMSYHKAKTLVALLLMVSIAPLGAGQLIHHAAADGPTDSAKPTPTPLAHRPATSDKEVTPPENGSSLGHVKLRRGPQDYKQFFIRALGVVAEYCEHISYANQYDGRIEASAGPVEGSPPVTRRAIVSVQVGDDGRFLIAVRVNKVMEAGPKRVVVGRDAELERAILRRLEVRQAQKEQAPPRSTKVTAQKDRLEVRADGKQVHVLAVFGGEEIQAVAARMSYDEGGVLVLEGDGRVRMGRRDTAPKAITCQKLFLDRKTGTVRVGGAVRVEGASGARQAVPLSGALGVAIPALGPAPVGWDFGFPVVKGPREDEQVFNFFLGWTQ
jgi:RNA polymerase sigma factor (sigma-70 family)